MSYLLRKDSENYKNLNKDGVLGLGLEPEKEFSNIITELHNNKLISLSRYSLFLTELDSKILYGDFSSSSGIGFVYKQMGYCKAIDGKCDVSAIEISKKQINIDSFAVFDTTIPFLTIPVTDFKILKKGILNESECILSEDKQILCKCTENKFNDIKLLIGGHPFVIKTEKIVGFFPEQEYQCRFEAYVDMNSYDTWVLGTNVLKDSLISFDLVGKKIGFIQNTHGLNTLLIKEEFFTEYVEESGDSKLGYIIAVAIIIIIMYGLVNFAQNKISIDQSAKDDKIELIPNKFNTDRYDFDKSFKDEEKK